MFNSSSIVALAGNASIYPSDSDPIGLDIYNVIKF